MTARELVAGKSTAAEPSGAPSPPAGDGRAFFRLEAVEAVVTSGVFVAGEAGVDGRPRFVEVEASSDDEVGKSFRGLPSGARGCCSRRGGCSMGEVDRPETYRIPDVHGGDGKVRANPFDA